MRTATSGWSLRPLEAINAESRKRAYDFGAIPWELGVDRSRFYSPEAMSHLYYCPSYHEILNIEERRFYNQVYTAGISEQFVFLEEVLLVQGLSALGRSMGRRLDEPMREAIGTFVAEEVKHARMFQRLMKLTFPEIYEHRRFAVYVLGKAERGLLDFCVNRPETFLWWIWVAILFEEKTLDFYRKYSAALDLDRIDPLHHAVHRYHAMDEVRHFQLDQHFLERFWAPAGRFKKLLNERIFHRMMWSFTHPRRTVRHAVHRLLERHPRLEAHRERILDEILSVFEDEAWQEAFYSRDALPQTFALFDRYPEMHTLKEVFPCYSPRIAS